MARAENIRVIYSDLSEEWHWKAGRHRKSHIRFGERVLEKYRRKRQPAGTLISLHVRFCEGAGVQFPCATRPTSNFIEVARSRPERLSAPVWTIALRARLKRVTGHSRERCAVFLDGPASCGAPTFSNGLSDPIEGEIVFGAPIVAVEA